MKHLKFLLILCTLVPFINACDIIEQPFLETTGNTDTAECPVPVFPADTVHLKNVLLEEYTGHLCVNCPEAAAIGNDLLLVHGDSLIVLAIHAGPFADPDVGNYTLDLTCPTALDLFNTAGIFANPAAQFNRKSLGGNTVFYAASGWHTQINQVLAEDPELDLQLISNYNVSTRKLCIHVQVNYLIASSRNLNIAIYIFEDHIFGYQKNSNASYGTIPDIVNYEFMHVLRGSVNGTQGTTLSSGSVPQGTLSVVSFKTVLSGGWTDENCGIIALVYDTDTKEIIQSLKSYVVD